MQKPKGTRDLGPESMEVRKKVEEVMRDRCEGWGFREVDTPTFEHLELFTLKSGEEIIDEIYAFRDKSERELALRPEVTASVMRFYSDELRARPKPLKLYYFSNCFRYEQPQKGRYREFWQFGTETIGGDCSKTSAETIALACEILDSFGLEYDLHIGYLGVARGVLESEGVVGEDQDRLMSLIDKGDVDAIIDFLDGLSVSSDCRGVLVELIDLVGEGRDTVSQALDVLESYGFGEEGGFGLDNLSETLSYLESYGDVDYTLDLGIARGLEYYTGTVFEIYVPGLGAQNQVCGGGEYSIPQLMGENQFSTGFAFGFDRVVEAIKHQEIDLDIGPRLMAYIIPVSDEFRDEAVQILGRMRGSFPADIDLTGRGIGDQISHADSIGVRFAVIIGEREVENGTLSLKDMESGDQVELGIDEAVNKIMEEYESL
ncbi:histidine--tRNA ligase [Methanonatronarchaeum sp. AMET-Sl]|uniref:histidine--tRNA ligase n=1 Tax=Methanonatronarchaeum sp. AMET-Sl TaxID=3037654 RepID=UPI00244E382E|nr:histidine--tRNA ligase [Methanonatronarchaeum sp. AMET-Sl]WGI18168.1 histidine--tRNA ligase [Methanonatronarchaeum sp. AMET-Sl]